MKTSYVSSLTSFPYCKMQAGGRPRQHFNVFYFRFKLSHRPTGQLRPKLYEILFIKKTNFNSRKVRVIKWTGGDEKTGKQEGMKNGKGIRRMGLSPRPPNQNS